MKVSQGCGQSWGGSEVSVHENPLQACLPASGGCPLSLHSLECSRTTLSSGTLFSASLSVLPFLVSNEATLGFTVYPNFAWSHLNTHLKYICKTPISK